MPLLCEKCTEILLDARQRKREEWCTWHWENDCCDRTIVACFHSEYISPRAWWYCVRCAAQETGRFRLVRVES